MDIQSETSREDGVENHGDVTLEKRLEDIMSNLNKLKLKMIDNQNASKVLFERYIDTVHTTISNNEENNKDQNNNIPDKSIDINQQQQQQQQEEEQQQEEQQQQQQQQQQLESQQKEIESYNTVKLDLEQKLQQFQQENTDLTGKIDSLQKIVLLLEKDNNINKASYADIKSSIEQIIEKGRLQLKTLNNERQQSDQYRKRLTEQQESNQQLRKENSVLKSKIQEMLILLQCASQEDDPNQHMIDELITENEALRAMLNISKSFGGISLSSSTTDSINNDSNTNNKIENFTDPNGNSHTEQNGINGQETTGS